MSDELIEMYDRCFERDSIVWIAVARENWLKISDRVTQLRQELSLAEEGLANYAQENERLRATIEKALDWCYRENVYGHVRNELEIARSTEHPTGDGALHK